MPSQEFESESSFPLTVASSQNPFGIAGDSSIQPMTGVVRPPETPSIVLDRDNPFESALIDMVAVYRRKRADYALDGEWDTNFTTTSDLLGIKGFRRADSAYFNILQKVSRLRTLRLNGRMDDPANESVDDTITDLANYAVLMLALYRTEPR